ncbi:hypothetical protein HMPREF9597_01592 [Cutibacterium acnes HL005PA4]|nr:hypothetical protein HMPREF9574_01295 [Cutibacterium acnes HL074PA1]EFS40403.1 hypothetical protein HMPREF9575_02293 [Cutibacterium acnes HL110PA1]EFS42983.1 hypothetical protein HMPREF9576_01539 [Cutibacterium acnes HL110PA2]EFS47591.1 hypothetical protein HMPREF9585_02020 [Cutibacterium acnes HL083PA1]EFS56123.1 hypothetical protein HMPREF9593_01087 [Cutibacterium acnes HL046PA2]EFS57885.1 hypothetical protein HMPREF9604_01789 [Cutibacterium acnes HL036PA1]EFS65662.1 hypothetical protein
MDAVKATKEPPDVTVNVVNHSAPLDLACRGPLNHPVKSRPRSIL